VRELSVGSLEVVLVLPPDVLASAAVMTGIAVTGVAVTKLDKILDAIKRVAGFPAEVRLHRRQLQADELDAEDRVAEALARHRRRQLEAGGSSASSSQTTTARSCSRWHPSSALLTHSRLLGHNVRARTHHDYMSVVVPHEDGRLSILRDAVVGELVATGSLAELAAGVAGD
jgi:hypothetical protein